MATTLISPGVSVSVTDDTAYTSGTSTSVPLFIIGTHKNKTTPSGSVATGTLSSNANKMFNITSQAELVATYGTPVFYSNEGTALNGYELNEYGLHAAYQFLATNSSCYVLNSAIDYSQLKPLAASPTAPAVGGTYWLDANNSKFGIFISNGGTNKITGWDSITPTIITTNDQACSVIMGRSALSDTTTPLVSNASTISINGISVNIAASAGLATVVNAINAAKIKNVTAQYVYVAGKYYIYITQSTSTSDLVINTTGTDTGLATALGLFNGNSTPYESYIQPIQTAGLNGDFAVVALNNANIVFQKIKSVISGDSNSVNAATLWYPVGSDIWVIAVLSKNSLYMGNYNILPSIPSVGDVWISTVTKANGMNFAVKSYNSTTGVWSLSSNINYYSSVASLPATAVNGAIAVIYGNGIDIASFTIYIFNNGTWSELVYQASVGTPTSEPNDGTYWFNNTDFVADIMINQNGQKWIGYRNYSSLTGTDVNGVIIAGSTPKTQSTGESLVDGDLWLDSSDQENYPMIYRYDGTSSSWTLIDNTDDYSPNGIIFKDARQDDGNGSTNTSDLVISDFVDPDAPNPELYSDGMLLFNTRISTNNVKEWQSEWFLKGGYQDIDYTQQTYSVGTATFPKLSDPGRWVTISGDAEDGSPLMGRKAQRSLIVKSLVAAVNSAPNILSEVNAFQLVAAPGYIELIPTMLSLSVSRKGTVFVVGDTPARLAPDSTSITNFANPSADSLSDSETGLVTASSLVGVYYPWGISTNVDGSDIMVPPSTIAMRTISYSDSISYPWYAPAGYTRGLVTNAQSVGYLDTETGNFQSVILDQGQRDTLYTNNINPIAYMQGQGLVVYGQKTRQGTATSLDRINVQRLVCLLITQLETLAKPFLFENNTEHTRSLVSSTFTRYMTNFVTLGGVYDFIVVCDDTNNTPTTIDSHELWIDIAIQPVETIEFIYIPMRLVNTGTDMSAIYGTNTTESTGITTTV